MTNPWLAIPLADYEGHMASPVVGQAEMVADEFEALLKGMFRNLLRSSAALAVMDLTRLLKPELRAWSESTSTPVTSQTQRIATPAPFQDWSSVVPIFRAICQTFKPWNWSMPPSCSST